MSTQSPPLIRKATGHSGSQGPNMSPREGSPSPSFRDRQRTSRGQSISYQSQHGQQPSPTASNTSFNTKRSPPPGSQAPPPATRKLPSPTYANNSPRNQSPERMTPPPPPVQMMSQPNLSQSSMHQQMAQPVPPQHQHSLSQSNIHQQVPLPPPPQHSLSQPNVHQFVNPQMAYHRPIPRVPPPQFLSMESFQMTPQLLAEIDQAHQLGTQGLAYAGAMSTQAPPNLSGLAGVAYAGGASSGAIPKTHFEAGSPPKDHPIMERLKAGERVSPKEPENAQRSGATLVRRDTREKEKERDIGRRGSLKRDPPSQLPPAPLSSHSQAPPREGSPQYHTPLTTPNEHTAAYTQYERESYIHPGHAEASSPPSVRKVTASSSTSVPAQGDSPALRGTPPTAPKVASQTPPAQTTKTRTPDKSLPVQEEPEEELVEGNAKPVQDAERDRWGPPASNEYMRYDHDMQYEKQLRGMASQSSPTPSSDLHPEGRPSRYDDRHDHGVTGGRDDDDDVEAAEDGRIGQNGHGDDEDVREQDEESYTPRSPIAALPDHQAYSAARASSPIRQQLPRIKNRNGSTDQLGLRSFDPTVFDNAVEKLQQQPAAPIASPHQAYMHRAYSQASDRFPSRGSYRDDQEHFLDDPAAAYYQHYMHSPSSTHSHQRPGAPIPSTPHSQTAPPSPSPLISGMQSEHHKPILPPYSPAPPGGSPYPYPYGHIRRGQSYAGSQNGTLDLSQYDPNVVREQLALQMQIYALNNGGMVSDSTLSPSSTPFPGPNYNPWAFLQTTRVFGGHPRELDSTASMRSSPSHEPVSLPPLNGRARSLRRRERSVNLRGGGKGVARQKIKPPPRVESTQPRETSPELSSGEETAGESKDEPYVSETAHWATGESSEDNAEWIDEEDVDGEEDDLLQLEYHTSYVSNPEKRRRRWKTRWEALVQAFQALDRETDATLVLLAAPSHSSKLHSLSSRALRRDTATMDSIEMENMRASFSKLANKRRQSRSQMTSLIDRISLASSSSGDGSPSSNGSKEEDLRRALETALGSLSALGNIYEQREVRWVEEMRRLDNDREKVQLLLRQVLGGALLPEEAQMAVTTS